MPAKRPREASEAFLASFKETLSGVTDCFLLPAGHAPDPVVHSVTLVPRGAIAGDPVPLSSTQGRRGLWLAVAHDYRIVHVEDPAVAHGWWEVSTARYIYRILDEAGNELLSYHWHPEDPFQPDGRSKIVGPHLHLSDTVQPIPLGRQFAPFALAEMHVRTGLVLLEDVVEFLVDECGVHPLQNDWRTIVEANRMTTTR